MRLYDVEQKPLDVPQQFIDADFGTCFFVYLLYDHCTVETVGSIGGGDGSGDDNGSCRDSTIAYLSGGSVQNTCTLPNVNTHR